MQVVDSFEVEDEVSARCDIWESELALCLLDLFEVVLDQDLILFVQVAEYVHVVLVPFLVDHHFLQCSSRHTPLKLLELYVTGCFVEGCFRIYHPFYSHNNESRLGRSESIGFQQVRMELVTIVFWDVDLFFEEQLPIDGHLSLDHMSYGEIGFAILACNGNFLLWDLQVPIFPIELQLKCMRLYLNLSQRFHLQT